MRVAVISCLLSAARGLRPGAGLHRHQRAAGRQQLQGVGGVGGPAGADRAGVGSRRAVLLALLALTRTRPPTAAVGMRGQKVINLATATNSQDGVISGQLGSAGFVPASAFGDAGAAGIETARAEAAEAPPVPQSQSFALANDTYQEILQWTVTGQTDSPLPQFGLVATSRTYGVAPIQGPAAFFGYNPLPPIGGAADGHGSALLNFFADAGDTNSSGAHGIEANISFTTSGGNACGAFEMVAVDDRTNTVNTTIRCGSGSSGAYTSQIVFENATASVVFAVMSNTRRNITFNYPVIFGGGAQFLYEQPVFSVAIASPLTVSTNAPSAGCIFTIAALGATSIASLVLNGNNTGYTNQINFQTAGTTQWQIWNYPGDFGITDSVNARTALTLFPGTAATAKIVVNSALVSGGSMVCGRAVLATTATSGFLYMPSCAGAPTGTPAAWAGTVPFVFDTTDNRLYFYAGGAWEYLAG
jgi:hypothetical protein